MNDTELDQLLNMWSVPPVPASLRASMLTGFHTRPERKRFFAVRALVAAAGIGFFLLAVTLALPQTLSLISPSVRAPYIVDSDVMRFANSGRSSLEAHVVSYNNNGSEIVLYQVAPSLLTGIRLGLQAVGAVWIRFTLPLQVSPELLEKDRSIARISAGVAHYRVGGVGSAAALLNTGCVIGTVVGHETILAYPTVAVRQFDGRQRRTLWMAPDLGCFALRMTVEERRPDGTFRLVLRKHATKVTLNGQ